MPGRIAVIQQQARELGRLRTGYSEATSSGKGRRPVRSETWIVTSHAEHYVEAAAATWGGKVERWEPQGGGAAQYRVITDATTMEAILPSGDPLSQHLELWSGGGAARRCDGITEQINDTPCVCLAQFGEKWHEQPKGKVCDPTSRLNVFLPDMPDVGVWRAETHSYYAAQEIAGAVDLIRQTTGGGHPLPIALRIEHRQRKAGGQTKNFPVIVVELRGINTGQVLTGAVQDARLESTAQRALAGGGDAPRQVTAGPTGPAVQDVESTKTAIAAARSRDDLTAIWNSIPASARTDEVKALFSARGAELNGGGTTNDAPAEKEESKAAKSGGKPAAPGANRGEAVDDVWRQVVASAPPDWSSRQLEDDFKATVGVDAGHANADHMRAYLDIVVGRDGVTS